MTSFTKLAGDNLFPNVYNFENYMRYLPTTNALLTQGSSSLISSSIGTGGTFSPPAVTIISFIRPVINKYPSESNIPTSPVLKN